MKFTSYASGSSGNLYSIEDGHTSILIECGLPYRDMQRLLSKPPTFYDACLVSHGHGDHYNGRTAEELRKRGIPVEYGTMYQHGETIGTTLVRSFMVRHDTLNHGFMFRGADGETCVFLIDTFYSTVRFTFPPTIVAIECNYARDLMQPGDSINDRLFASHMSLDQCIKTLQAWDLSKTREIHLLHLSDSRSDEARFVREVQAATGVPTWAAARRATA
jgi:phosphoribosyl 1,2-cyclic phosphodiesterase